MVSENSNMATKTLYIVPVAPYITPETSHMVLQTPNMAPGTPHMVPIACNVSPKTPCLAPGALNIPPGTLYCTIGLTIDPETTSFPKIYPGVSHMVPPGTQHMVPEAPNMDSGILHMVSESQTWHQEPLIRCQET